MEEFVHNLTSPAWLLSVFVVGIFIHLIGTFLYHRMDNWFLKTSSWLAGPLKETTAGRRQSRRSFTKR